MTTMRISQLAERCGVPATTLRFYEGAGLLPAGRSSSGYRVYGEEAVRRLAFITAAKQLGLPLEEIRDLLAVWEAGACAEVKADLLPRIAAHLGEAEGRVAELAAFVASLRASLDRLGALPDRAGRCDPECGLVAPIPSATPRVRDDAASAGRHPVGESWRTAPVACSLSSAGLAERVEQWRAAVAGAVRVEIPDGVRLTLPVERAGAVAALAAAELECCPFLSFRLELEGGGRELRMEVRAPAGGVALLSEFL
ncbi:MerR family transcriptional regulator [Solihabitans fulvus]|uniref:MerR family transcriptional regulator n=1 Tax=Solihabitans fulvus TaxID=1892852 RepID=A0A5B2XF83_9PSEU|nr:MerR family transcriptional regulator [Solihabitans fulvus]KAA2261570.1 MerR family transcriptional regulator [Solihabitans fulvus]